MAGTCKSDNESSGSIKCRVISCIAEDQFASQEGLCSMQQVNK